MLPKTGPLLEHLLALCCLWPLCGFEKKLLCSDAILWPKARSHGLPGWHSSTDPELNQSHATLKKQKGKSTSASVRVAAKDVRSKAKKKETLETHVKGEDRTRHRGPAARRRFKSRLVRRTDTVSLSNFRIGGALSFFPPLPLSLFFSYSLSLFVPSHI